METRRNDGSDVSTGHGRGPDPRRRTVLTGLAAACLSPFALPVPAGAQPAADAALGAARGAFLGVSKYLTGRSSLDPEQCARFYDALAADSAGFEADVRALLAWIGERNVDAAHVQRALDADGSALAPLPRKIVTAWYTGVVGEGGTARCVAFETSLMYQVVADRLSPPSYCYGPHGSWTDAPVGGGRDA